MDQILFSRQTRSDTVLTGLGIIIAVSLAVGTAMIAARERSLIALAGSTLLVFISLRAMTIYFNRRAFSFSISKETIIFGSVHKPTHQTRIQTNDIVQIDWHNRYLELKSGKKVQLPLNKIKVTQSDLQPIFKAHFPQIKSAKSKESAFSNR